MMHSIHRGGTILIIVAGICALLASLTLVFLMRMRTDVEEMQVVVHESQARIMLMAACNWIQEASRIGWSKEGQKIGWLPAVIAPGANTETFGWIDVRDNKIGPRFTADILPDGSINPLGNGSDALFPVGTYKLFPMYVTERPPYATQLTVAYNPIRTPVSPNPVAIGSPDFGMPYLSFPDPQPAVDNSWDPTVPQGTTVNASKFTDWEQGDQRPRHNSTGMSWFRVYRESGATFVVTCGGGGTLGHRSWSDMTPLEQSEFSDDVTLFESIRNAEVRLWYRVEWSAAVMGMDYHMLDHSLGRDRDHYMVWPMNASHSTAGHEYRTQTHARNMGGTIRWVQRLKTEPTKW